MANKCQVCGKDVFAGVGTAWRNSARLQYCRVCRRQMCGSCSVGRLCVECNSKLPEETQDKNKKVKMIARIINTILAIFGIAWFLEFYGNAFDLGLPMNTMFIILFSVLGISIAMLIFLNIYQHNIINND